jgi:F-type H+-transporting ATPase subunit b
MNWNRRTRSALQLLFVLSLVATAAPVRSQAQAAPASSQAQSTPQGSTTQPGDQAAPAQVQPQDSEKSEGMGERLAEESRRAAGESVDNGEFKYSASVKWFSKLTGMDVEKGYWVFTTLNFAIVGVVLVAIWRSVWPKMVATRNERIAKGLEDARRASAEAQRRLGDIESRLSKIDTEIAGIRSQAESEAKAEEARIKAASEEEKRRILQAADQEIASATANARRELKVFAANLAVSIAQQRIASNIDNGSDEQLVREFARRLGTEGHA